LPSAYSAYSAVHLFPEDSSQPANNSDYCSAEGRREERKKRIFSSAFLRALCVSALILLSFGQVRILIPFSCAFCASSRQRGFPHPSRQMAHVPSNRLRTVVFQAGLKAGFSRHWPPPARFAPESRCFSRLAWPLGRCRPPTALAMGQNRQKTGDTCLLPPSTSSGKMGPE
jgi:hypothetical protein